MWSARFRRNRSVFELCDTNMLVESWHHLLKGKFLEGKRNRRVDHLLHVLVNDTIPYFIGKHRRQEFGFEGPDLEVKRRMEVESRSLSIKKESIDKVEGQAVYRVCSQSDAAQIYLVDIEAYTCDCLSFPLIDFCKHICAVQRLFPEGCTELPISTLNFSSTSILSTDSDTEDDEEELKEPTTIAEDPVRDLVNRLQHLAVRTRLSPPSHLSKSWNTLQLAVDAVLAETDFTDAEVLPPRKKIAPNEGAGWQSTQAVMGVPVKGKRQSKHTDPYSGGEQSGRKGTLEARQ
ncbi:hypothetical protein C8F04DRAFT_1290675, partial [Mycena alexandri]